MFMMISPTIFLSFKSIFFTKCFKLNFNNVSIFLMAFLYSTLLLWHLLILTLFPILFPKKENYIQEQLSFCTVPSVFEAVACPPWNWWGFSNITNFCLLWRFASICSDPVIRIGMYAFCHVDTVLEWGLMMLSIAFF